MSSIAQKPRILLVDDDEAALAQLRWALDAEYAVSIASSIADARRVFDECNPQIVTLDINLDFKIQSSRGGLELLEEFRLRNPAIKIIMITGNDSKQLALEAVAKGAHDFYIKPVNIEELQTVLRRAAYIVSLEAENKRLVAEQAGRGVCENMLGTCAAMQDVFSFIEKVAASDASVLITGESGTGKELVSRAMHELSNRRAEPFVAINCAAIPENLLESELFGYEKGAFTDAHAQKKGRLELADAGTVFLDEIGEMPLALQTKLLRFLQERIIERLGGNTPIQLDVRVIAATNCDLAECIRAKTFREDLYYRLSVLAVHLPPLRQRGEDVLVLAQYFVHKYRHDASGRDIKGFTKEAKDAMRLYSWPGNIRELENKVRRAVILAQNSMITSQELGFDDAQALTQSSGRLSLKEARLRADESLIRQALQDSSGNMSLAAKMLGITRPTLYDLMKKCGLQAENESDA